VQLLQSTHRWAGGTLFFSFGKYGISSVDFRQGDIQYLIVKPVQQDFNDPVLQSAAAIGRGKLFDPSPPSQARAWDGDMYIVQTSPT
jgi:hypothetical protein